MVLTAPSVAECLLDRCRCWSEVYYGSELLNSDLLASWWVLLLLNVEVMCVVNVGVVSEMVSETMSDG